MKTRDIATSLETELVCPGCDTPGTIGFWEVDQVPTNVGTTAASTEQARNVVRGDIRLRYCVGCGLINNTNYDPNLIDFAPGYQVGLYHSDVFRQFITTLADRLVDRFNLSGKRVLDIGCGDGYFLRQLLRAGVAHCTGVDPTCEDVGRIRTEHGDLELIRDFWSAEHHERIGDLIVCQSVLEDIPQPLAFLQQIRHSLADRNVPIYVEVFNGYRAFERSESWSIHYEQCNYFSQSSLAKLITSAGFEITDVGSCYQGDQYLYVEAKPRKQGESRSQAEPRKQGEPHFKVQADSRRGQTHSRPPGLPAELIDFSAAHSLRKAEWRQTIAAWRIAGKRVLVWGSGGKGISLLNAAAANDVIPAVVDINPDRQGTFIPGAGQPIVGPQMVAELDPHVVVITNSLYETEIRKQLQDMGIDCEICIA